MRRRTFLSAAGGLAVTPALRGLAHGARLPPRVSFLSHSSETEWGQRLQEFRTELRSLGYLEGRELLLDAWWAENRPERIPALITDIIKSEPAVIVTHGSANVAAL